MDELDISGKRYISSKRAAKENRYHVDYIGQLIRSGKIIGSKVGRTWYVEEESLASYLGQEFVAPSKIIAAPIRAVIEKPTTLYQEQQKQTVPARSSYSGLEYVHDEEPMLPTISRREHIVVETPKPAPPVVHEEKPLAIVEEIQIKTLSKRKSASSMRAALFVGFLVFVLAAGVSYYLHFDTVVDVANVYSSVHF